MPISAWEASGLAGRVVSVLGRLVSPYRAFRILKEITLYHRIQGSPGLLEAARRVEELILEAAPDIVETELIEYTGKAGPDWFPLPAGWSVETAVLVVGDREYRLEAHPTLVAAHSPPSDGWIEGEVVVPSDPLDPDQYNEKDKIYLITRGHSVAYRIAAEQGVAGVILAKSKLNRDAFPYIGIFLTQEEAQRYTVPAVTLPWREAESIEGKTVRLRVDATIGGPGRLPVVAAWIGDRSAPGPVIMGHLCHPTPGANDNASGASSSVEAFLALAEAIDGGRLEPPEATVRLMLMPEWTGTVLSMEGWLGPLATAGINLDMVGGASWAGVGPARILYPPLSAPEHGMADAAWLVSRLAGLEVGLDYYMFGSDHDILMAYGRESPMLNQWPDPQYHTDRDDADRIDPHRLAAAALIGAASAYLHALGYRLPVTAARRVVEELVHRHLARGDSTAARLAAHYGASRYGLQPLERLPPDWRPPRRDGILALSGGRRLVLPLSLAARGRLEDAARLTRLLDENKHSGDMVRGELVLAAARRLPVGGFLTLAAAAYGVEQAEWLASKLDELAELGVVEVRG